MHLQNSLCTPLEKAFIYNEPNEWAEMLSLNPNEAKLSPFFQVRKSYEQTQKVLSFYAIEGAKKNFIHRLILSGDTHLVSFFLSNSPYIFDCYPPHRLTAMHYAALGDSGEMVELLKEHGLDILAQDQWGRTPLHYAALNPNLEVQEAIQKAGGDWLQKDHYHVSPVDFLNHQSQIKSPLYISDQEVNLTALLALSVILNSLIDQDYLAEYPLSNLLSKLLIHGAEFTMAVKNKSLSEKDFIKELALFTLAQQLSITKLAYSAYVISKSTQELFQNITTARRHLSQLPSQSLGFAATHIFQKMLLSALTLQRFPISFLSEHALDWLSSQRFSESKIHHLFDHEWQVLQGYGKDFFQGIRSLLKS